MVDETESLETRGVDKLRRQAALDLARQARLVVVAPADARAIIPLDENPLDLGRERLGQGTGVSRKHLAIGWQGRGQPGSAAPSVEGGRHHVADAGSKNGSWLDGTALTSARALVDGAVIRAGGAVLVYEAGPAPEPTPHDAGLVAAVPGRGYATLRLRNAVVRAAADPAPALVLGETGAGKERVARELHRLSGRPGPFVAVNVAELSDRLVESQLFGHVKGAFTGADAAQPGLFRAAQKGTLLLDEIGELALELQAKLLRVIQEREVRPVGATRAEPIDVRVVAATHADLSDAVEAGRFRRDLWARLSLWEVDVPPLSARRADVLELLQVLYERWASERGRRADTLAIEPEAAESLLLRPLAENLRTLDRVVHRLDPKLPRLTVALLDQVLGPNLPPGEAAAAEALKVAAPPPTSVEDLQKALAEHGSVHALARHYGKDRRQIYRWLEHYGLRSKG